MNSNDLQTLLDINNSTSFQDLQSKVAYRLDAMQMGNAIEGYYDEPNGGKMSCYSKFNPNSRFYNKDAKRGL